MLLVLVLVPVLPSQALMEQYKTLAQHALDLQARCAALHAAVHCVHNFDTAVAL